jgi:hypothetical protein
VEQAAQRRGLVGGVDEHVRIGTPTE